MPLSTYVDLQNTVQDYVIRPAPIINLIALAEADLQPLIKHYMMEKAVTVSGVTDEVTFPNDIVEFRSIKVDGITAKPVSPYNAVTYPNEVGYFFRGNSVKFVGLSDEPVDVTLDYYGRFEPLSDDNETNWLLTRFPAVYLHATLARAYRYLRDAEGEAAEKASLGEALGLVATDHSRTVNSGNSIISEGRSW